MKSLKLLFGILTAIFILFACKPPVVFNSAYPLGENDLLNFPEIYQGLYLCESDSSLISIEEDVIIIKEEQLFRVPAKIVENQNVCQIIGDTIYILGDGRCYPIQYINDSIVEGRRTERDTIFLMGSESVVRSYKGHIILSEKMDFNEWAVHILTMDEDFNVTFRAITDASDIEELKQITLAENITIPDDKYTRYRIEPTMIEFDQLLESKNIFIECDYFIRLDVDELIPWVF